MTSVKLRFIRNVFVEAFRQRLELFSVLLVHLAKELLHLSPTDFRIVFVSLPDLHGLFDFVGERVFHALTKLFQRFLHRFILAMTWN